MNKIVCASTLMLSYRPIIREDMLLHLTPLLLITSKMTSLYASVMDSGCHSPSQEELHHGGFSVSWSQCALLTPGNVSQPMEGQAQSTESQPQLMSAVHVMYDFVNDECYQQNGTLFLIYLFWIAWFSLLVFKNLM